MVDRHDLERRGALGHVRGDGIERDGEVRLVHRARVKQPRARGKLLRRDDHGRTARRDEPHVDACESRAPVVGDEPEGRRPADEVGRRLERHGGCEWLRARQEEGGERRQDDEGKKNPHQPRVSSTARGFRVMRWVAPQMTWPSTGYVSTGTERPSKSQVSRLSAPGSRSVSRATVNIASTSAGHGRKSYGQGTAATNGVMTKRVLTVSMSSRAPSTRTSAGARPISSCASRTAVAARSASAPGSCRPPGKATCP